MSLVDEDLETLYLAETSWSLRVSVAVAMAPQVFWAFLTLLTVTPAMLTSTR